MDYSSLTKKEPGGYSDRDFCTYQHQLTAVGLMTKLENHHFVNKCKPSDGPSWTVLKSVVEKSLGNRILQDSKSSQLSDCCVQKAQVTSARGELA